jgi:hypothetical protein
MAAFGAATVTATNKKEAKPCSQNNMETVSSQTFSFVIPASSTVASATLDGLTIPKYSYLLGFIVSPSATLGSSTLAFTTVTANVIFGAADTYTASGDLVGAVASGLNLITGSVDDTLSVALAAATSPSAAVTVTVTLILASYGAAAGLTTYSI